MAVIFFSSPNTPSPYFFQFSHVFLSLKPRQHKREREKFRMCPLRIILIFLSATLAGFFVLRNLNSSSALEDDGVGDKAEDSANAVPLSTKVCAAAGKGFWTCVDMASGRYLWRNLVSAEAKVRAE